MIAFNVFENDNVIKNVIVDRINIHIDDLYKDIYEEFFSSDKFDIYNVLNKYECSIIDKDTPKEVTLVIFIIIDDKKLKFNVYQVPNILIYSKTRYKNFEVNGNCVDKFIIKGLYGELNNIDYYIQNIKDRVTERSNCLEYHQTACYEHDFNCICKIKNCLEKLLSNCNKQIEQMSDKYTKL